MFPHAMSKEAKTIENSLHWVPDVTLREDECRIRRGEAAENFVPYYISPSIYSSKGKSKRF
jgi:hypothetical protein